MNAAADTDVELIEHLDFDPDITCEVRITAHAPRCGKSAEWIAVCKVCGAAGFCCDGCKQRLQMLPGRFAHRCGADGTLAETTKFLPLSRRA